MHEDVALLRHFLAALAYRTQKALLRRLSGSPVAAENFLRAEIDANNVGPGQAAPRSPGRRDGKWDPRGVTGDE
jgi:hypothetical protein